MKHVAEIVESAGDTSDESLLLCLSLNGKVCSDEIRLPKPFSEAYVDDMRWYLESFIPKGAFDIDKATDMRLYLDDIREQLRLHVAMPLLDALLEQGFDIAEALRLDVKVCRSSDQQSQRIFNIYWELLEDPETWRPSAVDANVGRLIAATSERTSNEDVSSAVPCGRSPQRSDINVLLVLARDHSNEADARTDLAYQHLLAAKAQMEMTNDRRRLRLQMVRPGSFTAFKRHLEASTKRNGHGFFDVVHFDVHGAVKVAKGKGTKEGFLYFADPTPGSKKLKPVSARRVAMELVAHGTRIAVLNACESARSSSETDANLAGVFVSSGVSNVLAMSYRLLASAASAFTKVFYQSLLVDTKAFSNAAADARKELRVNPRRPTRFRTSEPVSDWIIPVVYTNGQDLELPVSTGAAGEAAPKSPGPVVDDFKLRAENVIGRGDEAMQLDRTVTEHSCVMVLGSPGIGKSAIVNELSRLWTQTGAYDLVLHIHVREQNVRNRADLVDRIATRMLLDQSMLKIDCADLDLLRKGTGKQKDAVVLAGIMSRRTVLVLDGIRDGHHNLPIRGFPAYLTPTEISELSSFVNEAVASSDPSETRVVLITRHDLDSLWASRLHPKDSLAEFAVSPLSLADAFELATSIFAALDVPAPHWHGSNADALEQVLLLCDINPLAIRHVVTALAGNLQIGFDDLLMRSVDLPFLIYAESETKGYSRHSGSFDDLEEGTFGGRQSGGNKFLFEMHQIFYSFHPRLQLALCYLGLYWHSGPDAQDWAEKMMIWGVCEQCEGLFKIIQIVGNRLWIQSENSKRIDYIHPILTMFLRDRLCDQKPIWTEEMVGIKAYTAFLTMRCLLVNGEPAINFEESIVHEHLQTFSHRMNSALQHKSDTGGDSEKSPASWLHDELYNFLFICGVCTNENLRLVPSNWPKDGLAVFMTYVLSNEKTIQYRKMCVDAVGKLLSSMSEQYDKIMTSPDTISFWFVCMFHFLHTYNGKISTFPEKVLQMLSTIPIFVGGLDPIIWHNFEQAQLVEFGDICHFAALLSLQGDEENATLIREEGVQFYHRALQRVVEGCPEQQKPSIDLEELDETRMELLLQVRELEWQSTLQKSIGGDTGTTDQQLEELSEMFSSLIGRQMLRPRQPREPTASSSAVKAFDPDRLAELGSAYDESDILTVASKHWRLASSAWEDGHIKESARHLTRLNELVEQDPEMKSKFDALDRQTHVVNTALRALELVEPANNLDSASMEQNWDEFYALLGSSPLEGEADVREAYRNVVETQRKCPRGTLTMARLDPPQPQREMRARARERYGKSCDSQEQMALDTAWLHSCAGAVQAVEKNKYEQALSCVETMEQLQSSGMITWHDTSPMTEAKRWLEGMKDVQVGIEKVKAAVDNDDLVTAEEVMKQCSDLDDTLGNEFRVALDDRWQALRSLQWNGKLSQAKKLGENDQFPESLVLFNEIEEARKLHVGNGAFFAVGFVRDLELAKNQVMMRFAVQESRHLDVASAASGCLLILENTADEEMPTLSKPKMKLIQACAAIRERAMIRYHQTGLAAALDNDANDQATLHLDALISIGQTIEAYHPPEWLKLREELEVLHFQRESLRATEE